MNKLRLDLETLSVESFAPSDESAWTPIDPYPGAATIGCGTYRYCPVE